MVPYAFGSSDGLFNLGSALSFVQVLPPGVSIAMNGRCFPWDRVRKNTSLGVFEEIRSNELRRQRQVVRKEGLEPSRCYPQVPETCASTSSATFAGMGRITARVGSVKKGNSLS